MTLTVWKSRTEVMLTKSSEQTFRHCLADENKGAGRIPVHSFRASEHARSDDGLPAAVLHGEYLEGMAGSEPGCEMPAGDFPGCSASRKEKMEVTPDNGR
ncbi:MAG: hypothetical protein R2941_25135, partial [Desulfobacterales bacterium]